MSVKKKNVILNSVIEESVEVLSRETYKLVNEMIKDKKDDEMYADVHSKAIKSYIRHMVHDAFYKHSKEPSKKEVYEKTKRAYELVKLELQVKIAEAFEDVYTEFTGQTPEFYCAIKLEPEMNKESVSH